MNAFFFRNESEKDTINQVSLEIIQQLPFCLLFLHIKNINSTKFYKGL